MATTLSYRFTAELVRSSPNDAIDSVVDQAIAAGTLSGRMDFSTVLDTSKPPTFAEARYLAPIISIDGFDMSGFETLFEKATIVNNNTGAIPFDALIANSGIDASEGLVESLFLWLDDPSATAIDDARIFPDGIFLSDWEGRTLSMVGRLNDANGAALESERAAFSLSNLTPIPAVPLPAGMPLLIGGLAAFGLLRRKQAPTLPKRA